MLRTILRAGIPKEKVTEATFPRSRQMPGEAPGCSSSSVRRLRPGVPGRLHLLIMCMATAFTLAAGVDAAAATDTWSGYTQLGNSQVKGIAATSPSAGRIDLFVIGTDNAVWTKRSVNGVWSGYSQLGSEPVKAVAAASSSAGRIDLFVIRTDDAVWTKRSVSGVWSGYSQLGNSQVKGIAAASSSADRLHLFVIGTDNAVWTKRSVNGVWSGYSQLGNNQVKGIAATSPTFPAVTSGLIDLFVIGTDNAVWTKRSETYGLSFGGYRQVGPSEVKDIAAAATAKAVGLYDLNLLVIGTDNAVWKNSLVGCSTNCI
jgi:hypothetical protein